MASKIMAILPRGREDSQPRSAVHGGMHGKHARVSHTSSSDSLGGFGCLPASERSTRFLLGAASRAAAARRSSSSSSLLGVDGTARACGHKCKNGRARTYVGSGGHWARGARTQRRGERHPIRPRPHSAEAVRT
ncbi:hypothetical protein SORBI_3002G204350 [Sorghum bicolor]|uniref:Uncharacterized protein n=1 Tax=Sorghum bicolor TaxID=4558 RepID=A0A1W0W523_SORBI|nr:hypothetical protein SORBI_3002G204350 [Sorghum bicolor]